MTIEFEGGAHIIVRPNRVVRGLVCLDLSEKTHVTRIRIRFRGEEYGAVRVEELSSDGKGDWIHQLITTFFEAEYTLFGPEPSPYSQHNWEEMDAGHYEFPFAMKFPNVNYPPSMEEPPGFGIRYIWTAQIDGPGLQSGLRSREYITPYRPIVLATEPKEWACRSTLVKDKKPYVEAQAKLVKQCYCPDEPFSMQLNMTSLLSDSKITSIQFMFRKHHEGKILLQQGTAFQEYVRNVLQGTVSLSSSHTNISETVAFDIPTRLVSPSFVSRHTRVYYDLLFQVHLEHGHIFRTDHVCEFAIPLTIANLPFDQLHRVAELTAIQFYQQSKECPEFFDPDLDCPPPPPSSQWRDAIQAAAISSPPQNEEPPSYFSLQSNPLPLIQSSKERTERTVFMSKPARGAYQADISDATIIRGLYDESW
ncbi:hypothetical protein DM01DRAFT_1310025 [Hesseltinella vesiculosa]|uniref:Uncharacterized protein n=1 Tax=Hesseltinella vesiculosa TaxID=101127 RepID=A0A1X2G912_9FUNG|nr:hypothetical protein DM01DRAFT_1310025 [Hesseltinella vesiculosa]